MPSPFATLPQTQERLIYTGYIPVPALALTLRLEFPAGRARKGFIMRKTFPLAALLTALLLASYGCSRQAAAPSDQQLTASVQTKLQNESALAGQNIQVAANNGVVTLSGTAADPASRALAGNDAGSVAGVTTVVNNLTVLPPQNASVTPEPPLPPSQPRQPLRTARPARPPQKDQPRHDPPSPPPPPPANDRPSIPPPTAPSPAPAPPPQPVLRTVTLQPGTVVPVRLSEPLDSQTAQADQTFHATLAADLVSDNMVVVPIGTPVLGRIVDAKDAAHFKGNSLLVLELTSVNTRGRHISIVTDTVSQQGAGRGKNTAVKAGGGALLGTVIGAIAGGGKGAAIGAVAGAGAGTGINAATRGQQVKLPEETLLNFTLQQPITLTTSRTVGSASQDNPQTDPSLQTRPQ